LLRKKKSTEKKSRKNRPAPIEKVKKVVVKEEVDKKKEKKTVKGEKKGEKKEEAKPVKKAVKPTATPVAKPEAKPVVKKVVKKVTKKATDAPKKERKCKATNNSRKRGSPHRPSGALLKKWRLRNSTRVLEVALSEQFEKGRLYAKISTSPGQVGSADGYVLEGEELAFYVKKMQLKKKK